MDQRKEFFGVSDWFSDLASEILEGGAYKATKYISDKLTVKATRKLFKCNNRKIDNRSMIAEIIFTVGRPNYEEREFIRKAKKAGEPFSIKKIQLKYPK
jgi:hypothetical protein